jgi:hypothetical protein
MNHHRSAILFVGIGALLAGSLVSSVVLAGPAGAAPTLFVSASGNDTNPCSDPAPCATISHALSVAGSGSAIEVAGTIADNISLSFAATIEQWPGQTAAVVEGLVPGAVFSVGVGAKVSLEGLTVTHGIGGGILNSGSVTVTNCTISNNTASVYDYGGGSIPFAAGGGIYNTGTLTITRSTIFNNSAGVFPVAYQAEGGGIFSRSTDVVRITDSTISNNYANSGVAYGGGITFDGVVIMVDDTFSHNSSTGSTALAGGVYENSANAKLGIPRITDSTISDNSVTATVTGGTAIGGGIDDDNASPLTITDSTINNNSASAWDGTAEGGGIGTWDSLTIADTTITKNSVATGPAGFSAGGGIFDGSVGNVAAATIVAANTAEGTLFNCVGPLSSSGYNLTDDSDGGQCGFLQGTDKINVAPDLSSPAANGGPTLTMLPAVNSPAVGMIPSPLVLNGIAVCGPGAFDQRGVSRPTPGSRCSIGAVESAAGAAPAITSASGTLFTARTNESFEITTNGLPTPALSVSSGTGQSGLPEGVTFLDNGNGTASLEGVAPAPGIFTFTISAYNGVSPSATQAFTLVIQDSLSGGARMAALPNGTGYWIVHPDGGVFSYGAARLSGSLPGLGIHVNNIVGIAATPDGMGYWLVGSDGGVFAFGDASYLGSMGGKALNKPAIAIAASPDGRGYWLVASDGGVFTFGDASFAGSMGGVPLNAPVVAMTADPVGGYWLVASDGGLFSFGGAPFMGSVGGSPLAQPVVGVTSALGGSGYWLVGSDGGVFAFGQARFVGSLGGNGGSSNRAIVGLFSTNRGLDYTLVEASGTQHAF